MTILTTQKNVDLQLTTKLGKDKLIIEEVTIDESLHDLFDIKIIAYSTDIDIDLNASLGKPMTVCLNMHSGKRYFSGVVARFEQIHTTVLEKKKKLVAFYHIRLVPKFWLLKHSKDYRIFQQKSTQEIIKTIMGENQITDFSYTAKKGTAKKREFCVQYDESNFDFIVRLCEEEGVFFHIEHTNTTHKLFFVDADTVPKKIGNGEFSYAQKSPSSMLMNTIYECVSGEQVKGSKLKISDYNYLKPATPLKAETAGKSVGGTYFNYPGLFAEKADGDARVKDLFASLSWAEKTLQGTSSISALMPFQSFKMKDHPRKSLNVEYVVYRVRHKISQTQLKTNSGESGYERTYENNFWAYPAKEKCKPELTQKKPRIHSLQTATVTGPDGEEIYSDKYGRVKVKFHWDSRGEDNDKSSCWIRVAQNWAGSSWGGLILPRIGMEVVVSFMDGDPDRPLIMGCVYNGDNMPPYEATENTKSTFMTSSSKGDDGYNELRFEDKAGSEEIYIHAQKDMNVVIENERTEEIVESDDTLTITAGSKTISLDGEGTIYLLEIKDGDNNLEIKKGNHTITLSKGDLTIDVTGKIDITATDNITISSDKKVMITGKTGVDIKSDASITHKAKNIESTADINCKTTAKMISMTANASFMIKAAKMNCLVDGPLMNKAATITTTVDGPMTTKAGMMSTIVSGPVTNKAGVMTIIADGPFTLKGAVTTVGAQGAVMVVAQGMATVKGAAVMLG
jgi:type VI secretion system secreted protein VgrG